MILPRLSLPGRKDAPARERRTNAEPALENQLIARSRAEDAARRLRDEDDARRATSVAPPPPRHR
ncbi:MAG: hypothetical protein HZB46_10380 [Solirubrobacterales bacterium]|nr:hypothetical protein [Solirubrobacterales bacterium]